MKKVIPVCIDIEVETVGKHTVRGTCLTEFRVKGRDTEDALHNAEMALKPYILKVLKGKNDAYKDTMKFFNSRIGDPKNLFTLVSGTVNDVIDIHGPITKGNSISVSKRIVNQIYGALKPTVNCEKKEDIREFSDKGT